MTSIYVDTLKEAAAKLREVASVVPSDRWGDLPWQTEECADESMANCKCIVSQGVNAEWDQVQNPPMQYVADAETPKHAAFIATMHPGVAGALATWLETEAKNNAGDEDHTPCTPDQCPFVAALATARQILGQEAL